MPSLSHSLICLLTPVPLIHSWIWWEQMYNKSSENRFHVPPSIHLSFILPHLCPFVDSSLLQSCPKDKSIDSPWTSPLGKSVHLPLFSDLISKHYLMRRHELQKFLWTPIVTSLFWPTPATYHFIMIRITCADCRNLGIRRKVKRSHLSHIETLLP